MICAIFSYKGGVSKTTTALNLAAALIEADPKTRLLLVDLCPSRALLDSAAALPVAEFVERVTNKSEAGVTLIDCAPEMAPHDVAAVMSAADFVLIPCFVRAGAAEMALEAVKKAREHSKLFRVFLTGYVAQQRYCRLIRDEMRAELGEAMCKTIIPGSHAICAAEYEKRTVIDYAPDSPGARGYRKLARELRVLWL